MGHIKLRAFKNAPIFRKIAMGTWSSPSEASIYSRIDLDMSHAIPFIAEYSQRHNIKITPIHLIGKAMILAIKERPEINGMIRGSKIYLREKVALFFSVNIPPKEGDKAGKAILSGATLEDAEGLTVAEIARK